MCNLKCPLKAKIMEQRKVSEILLTSAVICKQKLSHGNEIMKYHQNCRYHEFDQGHILQSSCKVVRVTLALMT